MKFLDFLKVVFTKLLHCAVYMAARFRIERRSFYINVAWLRTERKELVLKKENKSVDIKGLTLSLWNS